MAKVTVGPGDLGHLAYHRAHRITVGEKVEGDRPRTNMKYL